jgi:formate hydrogenlyase subunit 3/multisubunit Na+/H+ antiporter MnhD subunit
MNTEQIIDSFHILFLLCINTGLIVTSTNDNLILLMMFPYVALLTSLLMVIDTNSREDYERWYYYFVIFGKYGTLFVLILRVIISNSYLLIELYLTTVLFMIICFFCLNKK